MAEVLIPEGSLPAFTLVPHMASISFRLLPGLGTTAYNHITLFIYLHLQLQYLTRVISKESICSFCLALLEAVHLVGEHLLSSGVTLLKDIVSEVMERQLLVFFLMFDSKSVT